MADERGETTFVVPTKHGKNFMYSNGKKLEDTKVETVFQSSTTHEQEMGKLSQSAFRETVEDEPFENEISSAAIHLRQTTTALAEQHSISQQLVAGVYEGIQNQECNHMTTAPAPQGQHSVEAMTLLQGDHERDYVRMTQLKPSFNGERDESEKEAAAYLAESQAEAIMKSWLATTDFEQFTPSGEFEKGIDSEPVPSFRVIEEAKIDTSTHYYSSLRSDLQQTFNEFHMPGLNVVELEPSDNDFKGPDCEALPAANITQEAKIDTTAHVPVHLTTEFDLLPLEPTGDFLETKQDTIDPTLLTLHYEPPHLAEGLKPSDPLPATDMMIQVNMHTSEPISFLNELSQCAARKTKESDVRSADDFMESKVECIKHLSLASPFHHSKSLLELSQNEPKSSTQAETKPPTFEQPTLMESYLAEPLYSQSVTMLSKLQTEASTDDAEKKADSTGPRPELQTLLPVLFHDFKESEWTSANVAIDSEPEKIVPMLLMAEAQQFHAVCESTGAEPIEVMTKVSEPISVQYQLRTTVSVVALNKPKQTSEESKARANPIEPPSVTLESQNNRAGAIYETDSMPVGVVMESNINTVDDSTQNTQLDESSLTVESRESEPTPSLESTAIKAETIEHVSLLEESKQLDPVVEVTEKQVRAPKVIQASIPIIKHLSSRFDGQQPRVVDGLELFVLNPAVASAKSDRMEPSPPIMVLEPTRHVDELKRAEMVASADAIDVTSKVTEPLPMLRQLIANQPQVSPCDEIFESNKICDAHQRANNISTRKKITIPAVFAAVSSTPIASQLRPLRDSKLNIKSRMHNVSHPVSYKTTARSIIPERLVTEVTTPFKTNKLINPTAFSVHTAKDMETQCQSTDTVDATSKKQLVIPLAFAAGSGSLDSAVASNDSTDAKVLCKNSALIPTVIDDEVLEIDIKHLDVSAPSDSSCESFKLEMTADFDNRARVPMMWMNSEHESSFHSGKLEMPVDVDSCVRMPVMRNNSENDREQESSCDYNKIEAPADFDGCVRVRVMSKNGENDHEQESFCYSKKVETVMAKDGENDREQESSSDNKNVETLADFDGRARVPVMWNNEVNREQESSRDDGEVEAPADFDGLTRAPVMWKNGDREQEFVNKILQPIELVDSKAFDSLQQEPAKSIQLSQKHDRPPDQDENSTEKQLGKVETHQVEELTHDTARKLATLPSPHQAFVEKAQELAETTTISDSLQVIEPFLVVEKLDLSPVQDDKLAEKLEQRTQETTYKAVKSLSQHQAFIEKGREFAETTKLSGSLQDVEPFLIAEEAVHVQDVSHQDKQVAVAVSTSAENVRDIESLLSSVASVDSLRFPSSTGTDAEQSMTVKESSPIEGSASETAGNEPSPIKLETTQDSQPDTKPAEVWLAKFLENCVSSCSKTPEGQLAVSNTIACVDDALVDKNDKLPIADPIERVQDFPASSLRINKSLRGVAYRSRNQASIPETAASSRQFGFDVDKTAETIDATPPSSPEPGSSQVKGDHRSPSYLDAKAQTQASSNCGCCIM